MIEWNYGTPSAAEWAGMWKLTPDAALSTETEYDAACDSLARQLKTAGYNLSEGMKSGTMYLRYDGYGDDSIYLEMEDFAVCTIGLIRDLQTWIASHSITFRVIIPTYTEFGPIMVYYNKVRVNCDHAISIEDTLDSLRHGTQ